MTWHAQPEAVDTRTYTAGDGLVMARFWLIDPRINRNGWRAPAESIARCARSFRGKPLIHYHKCLLGQCEAHHVTAGPGEPCAHTLELQEPYRVGTITAVEVTSEAKAHAIVSIIDPDTRERVDSGERLFVSPAVCPTPGTVSYEGSDTWGRPVRVLNDWEGMHLALVDSPAYGPEATIIQKCSGADCDPITGPKFPDIATLRVSGSIPGPIEARRLGQVSMVRDIDRETLTAEDLMSRARGIA